MQMGRGDSRWDRGRVIAVYVLAGAALVVLPASALWSVLMQPSASASCSPPSHGGPASPPSSRLPNTVSRAITKNLQEVGSTMVGRLSLPVAGSFTFGGILLLEVFGARRRAVHRSMGRLLLLLLSAGAGGWAVSQVYSAVVLRHLPRVASVILIVSGIGVLFLAAAADMPPLSEALRGVPEEVRAVVKQPSGFVAGSLILLLVCTPALIGSAVSARAKPRTLSAAEFVEWLTRQPRRQLPIPASGASVVLVKFNDYQCPPCRQTFTAYEPIVRKYRDKLRGTFEFVTLDYPLDSDCNPYVPTRMHPLACQAAAAVRLARRSGKGEALEEWLFKNQASLTAELIWTRAALLTGNPEIESDRDSASDAVRRDTAVGGSLGVRGTPTFFLNGVQFSAVPPDILDAALASEVARNVGQTGGSK